MKRFDPAEHADEKHLRVNEVAERLNVSADTVRRRFANDPRVRYIEQPGGVGKRQYRIMLIPESVYHEFYATLTRRPDYTKPRRKAS